MCVSTVQNVLAILADKGEEIARVLRSVPGNADVAVEATEGLPMLNIDVQREAIARHGINVADVQEVIEAAIGGSNVGTIVKGNAKFALTVRLEQSYRRDPEAIGRITVPASDGSAIPLAQLASITSTEGPIQISRENGSRRVVIQSNVRGRDLGSFVEEVKSQVAAKVKLPIGGGQLGEFTVITSLLPLYSTGDGKLVAGTKVYGKPSGAERRLLDHPRYAVGAVNIRSGVFIDAIEVKLMRIKGDRLDTTDVKTERAGSLGGGPQPTLGGDGKPSVGCVVYSSAEAITGVGLIQK